MGMPPAIAAEVLESILWPSKKIDPKYQTWLAQLADGRVASGLLVERTADRVVLRDAEAGSTPSPCPTSTACRLHRADGHSVHRPR